MSNRKELSDARRKAAEATWSLAQIESLPRRAGQRVQWSNGVVWVRIGDDDWRPEERVDDEGWRYPSAHVASGSWETL